MIFKLKTEEDLVVGFETPYNYIKLNSIMYAEFLSRPIIKKMETTLFGEPFRKTIIQIVSQDKFLKCKFQMMISRKIKTSTLLTLENKN